MPFHWKMVVGRNYDPRMTPPIHTQKFGAWSTRYIDYINHWTKAWHRHKVWVANAYADQDRSATLPGSSQFHWLEGSSFKDSKKVTKNKPKWSGKAVAANSKSTNTQCILCMHVPNSDCCPMKVKSLPWKKTTCAWITWIQVTSLSTANLSTSVESVNDPPQIAACDSSAQPSSSTVS